VAVALALAGSMVWSLCAPYRDAGVEAVRKKGYPASLSELDAWYPAVPPSDNAALVYTNAFALLAGSGVSSNAERLLNASLPSRGQRLTLTAEDKRDLAELLAANEAALRLLYSAPASGRSRYPIDLREGFTLSLSHLGQVKQAVRLLGAEALLRASEGDAEKATQALLAAGRVADSLSEEPLLISCLVRIASWSTVVARLEQVLGLAQLTEEQLALLQRRVGEAERASALVHALAGEQASGIAIFTDRDMQDKVLGGPQGPNPPTRHVSYRAGLVFGLYRATGLCQKDEACYLGAMAKTLAAAELPYPARFSASEQAGVILTNPPPRFCIFSRMLLPALARVYARDADFTARIRAATTALAVERFRRAHGNALPDTLEALVPAYLPAVPSDPFDGKPLRFSRYGARHGHSYAVYSVGSDRKDDGGVDWTSSNPKPRNPRDIVFMAEH
jgi:hypothetical protein